MPGNQSGRTEGRTGRKKNERSRLVGMDQRIHVQVEIGYIEFQTDRRTDERTDNPKT